MACYLISLGLTPAYDTTFNQAAKVIGVGTIYNFNKVLAEMMKHAFPAYAFRKQMRYLRRHLIKKRSMTLRSFTILRFYLTHTTGWNVISKFSKEKNGRKAFKALRERYEGSSYHDLIKTQANAMMMKTFYRGDTMKFNWERFISIHLEAHRMFEDINEPLTESMKILFLKGDIRPEAALESSLEVAKGLPGVSDNFDRFVSHITSSVTNKRSRAEILKVAQTRQVSTFRSDRAYGSGRGKGFRGGPGRGRFGRGPNGRGRGRMRNTNNFSYDYRNNTSNRSIPEMILVEGKTLYPRRIYQKNEYNQLTHIQKGELLKG